MADDLMRFNIKTVLVEDVGQITLLLDELRKRVSRRTVLVSGSAADFLKIAPGLGLGIGVRWWAAPCVRSPRSSSGASPGT
ncbi:hypothetical protein [Bradyrhizobium sp. Ai1a-2]|uniref:hypothetical protein n=1 Tax=Bradyrhizobium sp. Ai1a-2 TaxID=196490 RepID=UPI001268AB87|nr:hypothetical protein [Bradyrhizobium sp. Ai1a-2]